MLGPLKPRTSSATGLRITSRFQGRCDNAKGGGGRRVSSPSGGLWDRLPQIPNDHRATLGGTDGRPRLMGEGLAGTKGF